MPCTQSEKEIKHNFIMQFRQQSFKNGYGTLGVVYVSQHRLFDKDSTCKRSSKSRTASFFIADAFSWNRRIVPRPKVGMWRYLFNILNCHVILAIWRTYRQFNAWILSTPATYSTRNRWVKMAFQTPSSNSWRRSGTSMEKKLKPNWNKLDEKAFYQR